MSELYIGKPNQKIVDWCKEHYRPIEPDLGPLCFTGNGYNSTTVRLTGIEHDQECAIWCHLQYSTNNKETWNTYTGQTIQLNKCDDDKVYFKAEHNNPNTNGFAVKLDDGNIKFHQFIITGSVAASGNIQYLLSEDGKRRDVPLYCYYSMFSGCTWLSQAPTLPATTLKQSCYMYMFVGCSKIKQPPELNAETLAEDCYNSMFDGCAGLTTAPILPAKILAARCYYFMFYGCTNLVSMNINFSQWYPSTATFQWLSRAGKVVGEKTFTCPNALPVPETRSANNIPEGWNIIRK